MRAVRVPLSFKEKQQVPSDCDKTQNLIISACSSGVSALNAWQSALPPEIFERRSAISKDEYNVDIFQILSLLGCSWEINLEIEGNMGGIEWKQRETVLFIIKILEMS